MRWNDLTGLEPETEEDRRRLRSEGFRFFSAIGRVSVVYLLSYALTFSIPDAVIYELSEDLEIAGYAITYTALDPAVLIAAIWALTPMCVALYNLLKLKKEAASQTAKYEWEGENDAR